MSKREFIQLFLGALLVTVALAGSAGMSLRSEPADSKGLPPQSMDTVACTSFCLQNSDYCLFGTNFDNTLEIGLLFVNKRDVLKTTWDPNPAGEYARWVSKYGSVTVNFVGYQMAWGGMNEAGLMISTMSLNEAEGPALDERLPFESPFWMQYQLDTHSTVDQVLASDAEIRLPASQVDHYLVCDRTGECAVLEFLEGRLIHYTGESLPVKALTNSTYEISLQAREEIHQGGGEGYGNSIRRFVTAADRLSAFAPSSAEEAVQYAFDTLEAVSREDTVWSFVYDPVNLGLYFRTNQNPEIRALDFSKLDFSCRSPVQMIDVHKEVSGDIRDSLGLYNHAASVAHTRSFFYGYEGMSMSPLLVEILLRGVESFPCQEGKSFSSRALERYQPLVPPTIRWAGLTLVHNGGPYWVLLITLSLAYLLWRMTRGTVPSLGIRLRWALTTLLLGPFGLMAYLLSERKKRHIENGI